MNPILRRVLTGLVIGAAVIAAILLTLPQWMAPVVYALILLALVEFALLLKRKFPLSAWGVLVGIVGLLVIPFGLLSLLKIAYLQNGNKLLLYVVAIVKFSDVGGFAVGVTTAKMMKGGNHKLCPSISPGKSWEGLFGSLLFSSLVSCAFIGITSFPVWKAILFGVVAALVGTAGDLVESKFKRWIGVKDSSAMAFTNGMGGFLDMIDSLLFAPAVLLAMM